MKEEHQAELLPESGIVPLNAIRVETVLSRLPVHRLSRQGNIKIELSEVDSRGTLTLGWKVTYNVEHGQPGPLAYKLDTLVINRRIEESPQARVPRLHRLGSLSEICRELNLADSGKNRSDIKKALLQNSSAYIEPNFKYTQADGTEDTLDTGFSRYSVIFTGKKLPTGKKADSVYISLSDVYLNVIRGASTRPLDYDYLKSLPPAAQRFYEILSFRMYGTLMNDRPRAKLIYSEVCARAPQKRHATAKLMKLQMKRIHRIHLDSGYIADVDYQEFAGKDGLPDWVLLYKPGAKARAEFRAFQKRGGLKALDIEPLEEETSVVPFLLAEAASLTSPLHDALTSRGISARSADQLVQRFAEEAITHKIEIYDWLVSRDDKRLTKSPSGYLFASISEGYSDPKGFTSKAELERQAEARRQAQLQKLGEREQKQRQREAERRQASRIDAYRKSLTAEQLRQLEADAVAGASEEIRENLNSDVLPALRAMQLRRLVDERIAGELPVEEDQVEPA